MNFLRLLLPLLALPLFLGMAKKQPGVIVRFYTEANPQDTERFAAPVQLQNPPRSAFMEKVPSISERQVKEIYPFEAPDGSWGCAFRLDQDGRLALEVLSTDRRGRSLVAFIGTPKTPPHQVIDMIIDQRITDGIITIQRGLTPAEIALLKKSFPGVGQSKKPKAEKPSKPLL